MGTRVSFVRPRKESGGSYRKLGGEEFPLESIPTLPSPLLVQLLHMLSVPMNWLAGGGH